jgi:hypothetical protein
LESNSEERRRTAREEAGRRGESPAKVEKYLAGVHYPSEKKNLIDRAQDKNAPDDVLDLLNKLLDKTYRSPIDITREIGKIE